MYISAHKQNDVSSGVGHTAEAPLVTSQQFILIQKQFSGPEAIELLRNVRYVLLQGCTGLRGHRRVFPGAPEAPPTLRLQRLRRLRLLFFQRLGFKCIIVYPCNYLSFMLSG